MVTTPTDQDASPGTVFDSTNAGQAELATSPVTPTTVPVTPTTVPNPDHRPRDHDHRPRDHDHRARGTCPGDAPRSHRSYIAGMVSVGVLLIVFGGVLLFFLLRT